MLVRMTATTFAIQSARTRTQDLTRLESMPYDGAGDREPVLRVACADLNPGCDAVLQASTGDELLQQYVRHSFGCMHRTGPVELDRLLGAITVA